MRILFVSNYYPPAPLGGYTEWCHEVACALQTRGHEVGVLTTRSDSGSEKPLPYPVERLLHEETDRYHYRPVDFLLGYRARQAENRRAVRASIERFAPDVVFVWGMWNLSVDVAATVESVMGDRVAYYLCDYWPLADDPHERYWGSPTTRPWLRPLKRWAAVAARRVHRVGRGERPAFPQWVAVSEAVRSILVKGGLPEGRSSVVHGGIVLDRFPWRPPRPSWDDSGLRLLYAGQLAPQKDVGTAVDALGHLVGDGDVEVARLTIVGSGHPETEAGLERLARERGVEQWIDWRAGVEAARVPRLLADHDVLVFPSRYEEPLARTLQQAMATGLAIVATPTGGSAEMLRHGREALLFEPGDSRAMAAQLSRLADDPALAHRLSSAARRTVSERFTLDHMVTGIERRLLAIHAGATASPTS